MVFSWLKKRRRARILATPFPDAWLSIVQRNVGIFDQFSESERRKLLDDLRVFIAETNFEGCGGLAMTDEIKVTIAAQACVLLLGFDHDYFERVRSVLIYPAGFRSPDGWIGPDGVVHLDVGNLGEAWHHGTVIIAWDAVLAGGRNAYDGRNVVFHEFAHQLDFLDGYADGTPPLHTRGDYREWQQVMTAEYNQLVADAQSGHAKLLDSYGATNPAEFFAVATECFLEQPVEMLSRHPKLYDTLSGYYCQDPARRFAMPMEAAAITGRSYRGSRKRS